MDLKDGSKVDRVEAREWISWFWHEAVVRENSKSTSTRLAQPKPFVTPIAAVQFPMPAFSQNDAKWGFTHLPDRKSTRLNSSHLGISYAVFCLKKKKNNKH